jgi:multisubunit Na+/H+ antiporter MnhC subunit
LDEIERIVIPQKPMRFSDRKIPWTYLVATSVSGLGVGILVGLSASPVVNALITGIVSLAAGVVSALCGVLLEPREPNGETDETPRTAWFLPTHVNPVPIAFLVMSIVLGSLA